MSRRHSIRASLIAAGFMLLGLPAVAFADAVVVTGVASVIDGDTLEIHSERIRLFGIDACESRQLCEDASGQPYRCGQQAALALADHVGSRTVRCEGKTRDRYGRLVAICYLGDEDIDAWMVSQGLALAFRKYSTLYVPQEEDAQAAKRGLWAGSFEAPWEWRKEH
jgi:Micrococcal nuclease (thermonuclease) homologs